MSASNFRLCVGFFLLGWGGALASAAVDPSRLEEARALFRVEGKSVEAQSAFEAIARAEPNNFQAQLHLGLLAYRADDMEKALSHLEAAVRIGPNEGEVHKALGDAYGRSAQKASIFRQLGFAKKCLASYQRAVALAPDRAEFRWCLFEYYRQAPGFVGGGFDLAVAEAEAIKQLDPERGRIAFATLYAGEKKWEQAFAQFDDVLAKNPDDYTALFHVGQLAATSGRFVDRGLGALRRCLELVPPAKPDTPGHAVVQWRLGNLLEKKSDTAGARAAYDAALQLDPNLSQAADARKKLR